MDRNKASFTLGIAYIMFFVGMAAAKIGDNSCGDLFTAWDAIAVTISIVTPFVLGYQAGKT
jgi:hypothetical protein